MLSGMSKLEGWGLPRWPYVLALVVAIAGGLARYMAFAPVATGGSRAAWAGLTGQHTSFDLGVSGRRVLWLRTSVHATCRGGRSWSATWSPTNGLEVRVRQIGASFLTVQRSSPTYPGGVVGRIGFAMRGTFTGAGAAAGTVRLTARFYRDERETGACDSLDVPWAVGPRAASRVGEVAIGHQIGSYYPAVPSLATGVSPARARFIRLVDSVCVRTYNRGEWAQRIARAHDQYSDDHALLDAAYYTSWHAWQLRSVYALGAPPQADALYDAWYENFRRRVLIEEHAVQLYAHGNRRAAQRATRSLPALKSRGNLLGQRFGLIRCTSNGDRTPVPVLSDGQPAPLF